MTTLLYLLEMICIAPYLKLENFVFEHWKLELIEITPAVWSVSFPINSQPIRFTEVEGKLTKLVNFWFSLFGIDFKLKTHSLRMTPPELTQITVSIYRDMLNSWSPLVQAFYLYLTSCWASINFSCSFKPEWAKMILLKFTRVPFSNITLITAP
jgi:hypothetical protein